MVWSRGRGGERMRDNIIHCVCIVQFLGGNKRALEQSHSKTIFSLPQLEFFFWRREKFIYHNFNYTDQITLNFMLKVKIFLTNIFFNNVRESFAIHCDSTRLYKLVYAAAQLHRDETQFKQKINLGVMLEPM